MTSSRQGVNEICNFRGFWSKEFSIFFHEICMVARSYHVIVADIADIGSLLIGAIVGLETRPKVPILATLTIFGIFQAVRFGRGL